MAFRKTILYPTDFSNNARHALPQLREMIACFDATVHLLHVIEPSLQAADMSWTVPAPEMDEKIHDTAQQHLARLANELKLPAERVVTAITNGHPSIEITRYAKTHGIDTIVMSTHGHSGLSHFLLGSVTEGVVRKATCPVLTVRADTDESGKE